MVFTNTIWLTGLSGAGKSTLAQWMKRIDFKDYIIVDGDDLRQGLCADLGYSSDDRMKNVERAAHVCNLLNNQGFNVIACMMSPLESHREKALEILGDRLFLVYVSCSIEEAKRRDPKGIYKRFENNEIKNVSGIDTPFEPPMKHRVFVNTEFTSLSLCGIQIKDAYDKWVDLRTGCFFSKQQK